MSEDEIHSLRAANSRLQHQTQLLKSLRQRADRDLATLREQLESEKQLVRRLKKERTLGLRGLREDEIKKYECAIRDLRARLQTEVTQSLEQQRVQLERNFRSELMTLVHKKDSQLHLLFSHTQQLKRDAERRRTAELQRITDSYQLHLDKLKQAFQKQLIQLLLELKTKERQIETLRRTAATSSSAVVVVEAEDDGDDDDDDDDDDGRDGGGESLTWVFSTTTNTTSFYTNKQKNHHSRPAWRNKSYRQSRTAQQPYSSSTGKRRHAAKPRSMKEIGERQPVDSQQFFYHHHFGGSALETLPEAESEEECSEAEDASENGNALVTSCSSQASDENFPLSGTGTGNSAVVEIRHGSDGGGGPPPIIRCDSSEDQRSKILSLELTIRQLREELRECKDQNELLEFRLLEIEEVGGSNTSTQTRSSETQKCGKAGCVRDLMATGSEVTLYDGTEVPAEVAIRGDFDSSSNSHASVAESRSSCSDCSDSLSLQESGIFDSHSVNDDSYAAAGNPSGITHHLSNSNRENISRELANLTTQIENLVLRFAEGSSSSSSSSSSSGGVGGSSENVGPTTSAAGNEDVASGSLLVQESSPHHRGQANNNIGNHGSPAAATAGSMGSRTKSKRGQDFTTELKSCRQKVHEFELQLNQFADISYVTSLEDKVGLLIQENQRLEEERAEIEEAENDSRHQCQRLEEKVLQLRQKKSLLQRQLASEKLFIEQLRLRILQLQEREEELSAQVVRVDGLVATYEQENFELEESCIEMKCSVQFVVNCLPVLVMWYLWSLLRAVQREARRGFPAYSPPSIAYKSWGRPTGGMTRPTPPTRPPLPRKHKLVNMGVMSTEPRLKKLRAEMLEVDARVRHVGTVTRDEEHHDENDQIRPRRSDPKLLRPLLTTDANTQTCTDLWESALKDQLRVHEERWEGVETLLKQRIELLQCDIEKSRGAAETERRKIISNYESKLAEEQGSALRASQQLLREKKELEERWDSLMRALEQLVSSVGNEQQEEESVHTKVYSPVSSNSGSSSSSSSNSNSNTGEKAGDSDDERSSRKRSDGERLKGGGLVANRIRSLFPGEWRGCKNADAELTKDSSVSETPRAVIQQQQQPTPGGNQGSPHDELLSRLHQALRDQVAKFGRRERELKDDVERLRVELEEKVGFDSRRRCRPGSCCSCCHHHPAGVTLAEHPPTVTHCYPTATDNSHILYLAEENNRWQMILSDQETALNRVKELEEENERLAVELAASAALRKRLEDAHGTEASLRNRIEELEHSEISVRETVEQLERRERKCMERISTLREEIQFLRNKCCQLQDDLDSKVSRETKYKNEIHTLANKVKGLMVELEEKDNLMENNASACQSQLSKLRAQLNDVQQQLADAECTNGMLREEVLYLERTVQEAMDRASSTEKLVATLTCELRNSETTVQSLMAELESVRISRYQDQNDVVEGQLSNDLDIFAQKEGGLFGVDRDIKNIASEIQSCSRQSCRTSSKKLTEVSEQLSTLTLMLSGSPDMDRIHRDCRGVPELLSRCESDECLSRSLAIGSSGASHDLRKMMVSKTKECPPHPPEEEVPPVGRELEEVTQLEGELEERDAQIIKLRDTMSDLSVQICQLEDMLHGRQQELRDSHLAECSWYSARCRQKNDLIRVLARRLAHLSATDRHGIFLDSILTEVRQLECADDNSYPSMYKLNNISILPALAGSHLSPEEMDFTHDSLCLFLEFERKRIMDLVQNACHGDTMVESPLDGAADDDDDDGGSEECQDGEVEFRICRRVAQDALLVSWSIPDKYSMEKLDGYEISVNGSVFLRIPKPNRFKAVLYGLNLSEPLNLSLRCTGGGDSHRLQESTITYIA